MVFSIVILFSLLFSGYTGLLTAHPYSAQANHANIDSQELATSLKGTIFMDLLANSITQWKQLFVDISEKIPVVVSSYHSFTVKRFTPLGIKKIHIYDSSPTPHLSLFSLSWQSVKVVTSSLLTGIFSYHTFNDIRKIPRSFYPSIYLSNS